MRQEGDSFVQRESRPRLNFFAPHPAKERDCRNLLSPFKIVYYDMVPTRVRSLTKKIGYSRNKWHHFRLFAIE